jgi:hypothetical protein
MRNRVIDIFDMNRAAIGIRHESDATLFSAGDDDGHLPAIPAEVEQAPIQSKLEV